jgi:SAM-dependent methyltransferase
MTVEILEQKHGPDIIEGHLGGCSIGGDGGTYYPIMWKYLVDSYQIKTVLDIGCGRGFASKYFQSLGCDILGIDGSTKAQEMSLIPEHFLLNDYETGSALKNSVIEYNGKSIKEFVFDLCWCCEFVEHVWEEYSQNFIDDFKRCKYVAMTYAGPGQLGHHHVNCKPEDYWIEKMVNNGFEFLENDTEILKQKTFLDKEERMKIPGVPHFESHFIPRGLFFKNTNV